MKLIINKYEPTFRRRRDHLVADWFLFECRAEGEFYQGFVHRRVLKVINEETIHCGDLETIGFLVGRAFRDDQGYYAYVTDAIVAPYAERNRTTVRTTEQDAVFLNEYMQNDAIHLDKIGWWHSHPNLGLTRYSGTDHINQEQWCSEPHQMALLVARDEDISRIVGFHGPDSTEMGIRAMQQGDGPFESVSQDGKKTPTQALTSDTTPEQTKHIEPPLPPVPSPQKTRSLPGRAVRWLFHVMMMDVNPLNAHPSNDASHGQPWNQNRDSLSRSNHDER